MSANYDFQTQLRQGQQGEDDLDQFFADRYAIDQASYDQQRQGIDRIFTDLATLLPITVEYKSDRTASRTGNAFVETVSVENDQGSKGGWALSSQAEFLLYYLPDDRLVYVLRMARLRGRLERWGQRCRTRRIPNEGYCSVGLLVPLDEFERIAVQVVSL